MNLPPRLDFEFLRAQVIGADAEIRTPFGDRLMVYADYTASGRCLALVERYIQGLLRIYANTHTEDDISGRSMTQTMAEGSFFERYRPYFRFSQAEMDERRDGMLFDKLPGPLKPFTKQVFTKRGQLLMNTLRVPQTLGEENRKLVAGSPLLMGVMLDRSEYRPGQLSSFYSVFSMGAAMENVWLTTVELGMGIQFISFPMEVPGRWEEIVRLLKVPDELELMAVYRLGYVPVEQRRPAIDWVSHERKLPSQVVFRESCETPQAGWDEPLPGPGRGV